MYADVRERMREGVPGGPRVALDVASILGGLVLLWSLALPGLSASVATAALALGAVALLVAGTLSVGTSVPRRPA